MGSQAGNMARLNKISSQPNIRLLPFRNLEENIVTALATTLIDKLQQLPAQRLAEVENFVDFLHTCERQDRDRRLVQAAAQSAEPSFSAVWDNEDDAVYDRL